VRSVFLGPAGVVAPPPEPAGLSAHSSSAVPRPAVGRLVLLAFVVAVSANALEAYSLASVPVEWMAHAAVFGAVLVLGVAHRLYVLPGSRPLLLLSAWSLAVTVFTAVTGRFAELMPELATLPYGVFLAVRIVLLAAFVCSTWVVYWLLVNGYRDEVVTWTVRLGTVAAVLALYVYVAQVYGLPEPPRTRMGTTGGEQATRFQYAFHRAMGTFREPSHLAEWLTVPFFLSLSHGRRMLNVNTVLISGALLLTGSLTGILGLGLGLVLALLMANPFSLRNGKILLRLGIVAVLGLVIFQGLVSSYSSNSADLFGVIGQRVDPILRQGGLSGTNRGYVYGFVAHEPPPLLGMGLGNANIALTAYLGVPIISSFLSLYLNFLYATGYVGLALVCLAVGMPLARFLKSRVERTQYLTMVLASYLCYVIVFIVHLEEFTLMYALALALLVYETRPAAEGG
jgi:hypothetical protein